jgi:hypothetical protein
LKVSAKKPSAYNNSSEGMALWWPIHDGAVAHDNRVSVFRCPISIIRWLADVVSGATANVCGAAQENYPPSILAGGSCRGARLDMGRGATDGMAERVIDHLEIIEVKVVDCQPPIGS